MSETPAAVPSAVPSTVQVKNATCTFCGCLCDDMARLGLAPGDPVRLSTAPGSAVGRCQERKAKDLPAGLLFIPYGPSSSQLMDADTAGSGMPASKHLEVRVAGPLSADQEQDP